MGERILIVDRNADYREALARELRGGGIDCRVASSPERAVEITDRMSFDLVLCDVDTVIDRGEAFFRRLEKAGPGRIARLVPETAGTVRRPRRGDDCVAKVKRPARMVQAIQSLLRQRDRRRNIKQLKRTLRDQTQAPRMMVGDSSKMEQILHMVECASDSKCTILITGESGTGKEVLARAIHENSPSTSKSRFVGVNCAAIAGHLLESELFGHMKGAFTGATADKTGLFEAARGGTIFLDEIGEMSLSLQASLLRVLQEKEVRPVGSTRPASIDVRVICSTNRDLDRMVEDGRFRDDLYYRINVLEIHLPPLRQRRDEIPTLVDHFVHRFNDEYGFACPGADEETMASFIAHDWRGNIRELSNVIERALLVGRGEAIRSEHLPSRIGGVRVRPAEPGSLKDAVRAFERDHLRRALNRTAGKKDEAAKALGINLSTLYRKMKEHSISDESRS